MHRGAAHTGRGGERDRISLRAARPSRKGRAIMNEPAPLRAPTPFIPARRGSVHVPRLTRFSCKSVADRPAGSPTYRHRCCAVIPDFSPLTFRGCRGFVLCDECLRFCGYRLNVSHYLG